MKVLITTDLYKPSTNGVVRSVTTLKAELEALGHDVRILTLNQKGIPKEKGLYVLRSISADKIYPNARVLFTMGKRIVNKIVKWHPDIIHSQCELSTFIFANRLSKKLNIPLVHTYHTVYEDYTHYFSPSRHIGKELVESFSRAILKHTQAVIAPTDKVKALLLSYGIKTPITVIPTGLNLHKCSERVEKTELDALRASLGIPAENRVAVFLGRLAKEKNIDETIKLLEMSKIDNLTFVIVGDGPAKAHIEKHAHKSALKDSIIFTGLVPMDEVNKYYQLGDLFVCSSTSEAQGLTYFEALANGVPIICKKDACLDGVVGDYKNGFQYTAENDFCEFIRYYFSDKCSREQMHANAELIKEQFSSRIFGERVAALYESTIKSYDGRHRWL